MAGAPFDPGEVLAAMEDARIQALKGDAQRSSEQVQTALDSVHEVQDRMEQARSAVQRQTKWRWIAAVSSLIAALGLIWLSTSINKGFLQLSAELIGGALITYVVVERGVSALASIPARELRSLNVRIDEALGKTEEAVTFSRNLVEHVEGLIKLGD